MKDITQSGRNPWFVLTSVFFSAILLNACSTLSHPEHNTATPRAASLTHNDVNTDIETTSIKPEKSAAKEKVGIVMDFYNLYEDILNKLESKSASSQNVEIQIKSQYKDIYNINVDQSQVTFPTFYSLFVDADKDGKADIHNYDTVYINSRSESDIALLDTKIKRALLRYINNGGNLFITEWNIELLESDLDQYI